MPTHRGSPSQKHVQTRPHQRPRGIAEAAEAFVYSGKEYSDDFRPVEYAHEKSIPKTVFLSLFIGKNTEIQVSQSFTDGHLDVTWNRGCVFTAKPEGLGEPTAKVSAEDILHMRNRVQEYVFTHI